MLLLSPRKNYCSTALLVFLVCLAAGLLPDVANANANANANAASPKKASARLRGKHFDALEERVRNPTIDDRLRGKTLQELGGGGIERTASNNRNEQQQQQQQQQQLQLQLQLQQQQQQQARRKTQEEHTINFFSVYDEYGPSIVTSMGETAGLRGMIYDTQAKDDGLVEEFVRGALQGTCAVVASDGKQLCSYEIFVLNGTTGTIGTVVATGSVMMELGTRNVLIVEATGDDFVGYRGGMVSIMYTSIGDQTVMDLDLTFRR